jgi:hypothetical protein
MHYAFSPKSENHEQYGEMSAMSWHKISLPLTTDIDPKVVEIGNLARACYEEQNKPEGFGMLHAARSDDGGLTGTRLVYLSPVASELCSEIAELYTLEPCEVPARDEPDIKWVFGDPRVMGQLKDKYEPEAAEAVS